LLSDAVQGIEVDLPDMRPILPFIGLYTLVVLLPDELSGSEIPAHRPPDLFVLDDNRFISAPADTLHDAPGVVRIFDVSVMPDELTKTYYTIPLSPEHAEYAQPRYWRVPAKPEVILMILMERIIHVTESGCEEINHARVIYCILQLHKVGVNEIRGRKRVSDNDNDGEPVAKKGKSGLKLRIPARNIAARPGPRPRKKRPIKI
jgi:hypothetical protein